MGRTILITGASSGIGAETAKMLAAGNEIVIHYNNSQEKASRVAAEVEKRNGKVHLVQANLTTEANCEKFIELVSTKIQKLDVLVNNAGSLFERQYVGELSWTFMLKTFALNTFAPMKITSLCQPLLKKGNDPCIINITTIGIRRGAPSASIYGASKGAMDAFTRSIASELAPDIRVNAVSPGVIRTPFHDKISSPERFEDWRKNTPLKRIGEPVHIAQAVKFIIDNNYITGETIDVNGGQYMR